MRFDSQKPLMRKYKMEVGYRSQMKGVYYVLEEVDRGMILGQSVIIDNGPDNVIGRLTRNV